MAFSNSTTDTFVTSRLLAEDITLAYNGRVVASNLSVAIPDRSFSAIIGPNASGKSTLLRALSRLLRPESGSVYLDGKRIWELRARDVAKILGLLPQSAIAPDAITVFDLVSRGRYPHQGLFRQWSEDDEAAVFSALDATKTTGLAGRCMDELSGGQRQRVWLAMVLAQETSLLLLDEPTTYLDIAYQIELLELLAELNAGGRTVVAVLHDLNHACRFASHVIAMKGGAIVAEGKPAEIITEELVEDVFGLPSIIIPDPVAGTPMIVPKQKKVSAMGEVACQAQPSRASRPDLTAASRLNGLSSSRIPRKPHQG
ncbi:ABC transporter ATP-binding protein [Rhizobium sp. YJ-22]|uniref:ABC transporter ATP-binding protein n=1 Tax=Rhizobium sp. YJ-22 TaxID=3037556 RepID=UPI002412330D|nr:ABC transporter ATP-binding protein [Rhizobium sp. YJ-22]MDG3579010.1 ABC transporter ATP-binding protein [Rhizobium sp. YJ-22]